MPHEADLAEAEQEEKDYIFDSFTPVLQSENIDAIISLVRLHVHNFSGRF